MKPAESALLGNARECMCCAAAVGDSFGYGASYGKDYYVAGAFGAEDNTRFSHGKAYAFIDFELFPSA